jgi:homoserine dehydrogenase
VVGDLVDLGRSILAGTNGRVPGLAFQADRIRPIRFRPIERISTHYYFRFSALDRPGVLSKITGILGRHGISIQSMQQKGRKTHGAVPVVMLSHRALEADVKQSLDEIEALDTVSTKPVLIRIEDETLED